MNKTRILRTLSVAAVVTLALAGCDDENKSTLSALAAPGDIVVVERCTVGTDITADSESDCTAKSGTYSIAAYVANIRSGTVAYVPYSTKEGMEVIDITQSVPGASAIPVGDNPQSLATDSNGAFVVLTSSLHNNLSVISVNDNREIAFLELDRTPRKIVWNPWDGAFDVFFLDGTVQRLTISFDCGNGADKLTTTCKLTKDMIQLHWSSITTLDGTVQDFVVDPVKKRGYVTFSDRRYVSVLGFDAEEGTCLDGSSTYPCEIARYGAGFECSDGIDNDGDGKIDAEDATCFYPWSVEGHDWNNPHAGWRGIGECQDFWDNDGDELLDALDPGCVASNDASEADGFQPMQPGTCLDGIDNDGDGVADRDDPKCQWPTDDESSSAVARAVGQCRNGIDDDGDGKIDGEDLACYGKNGLSEFDMTSNGRGNVSIDPKGRWLYVLDPADSQLIVIDLGTGNTLDLSGRYPRHSVVGIPVSRLATAVAGDTRTERLYNRNNTTVYSDRAVAFVAASNGTFTEYSIFNTISTYNNKVLVDSHESMTLVPTDRNTSQSFISAVRCVKRLCTSKELPEIELRLFSSTDYSRGIITPDVSFTYDQIIADEEWKVTYEGILDSKYRHDGYFASDGTFHTDVDLCALGARPGDHLVLRDANGLIESEACSAFKSSGKNAMRLEWEITDVGLHKISLKPTGLPDDPTEVPTDACFETGLSFGIRANEEWVITSSSTYVNRRLLVGDRCVDNPQNPYGQMRFKLDPSRPFGTPDAQTAFFTLKMPPNASQLTRDAAFEFNTHTNYSATYLYSASQGGAAGVPSALRVLRTNLLHYLLVSDAVYNSLLVYDVDAGSVKEQL